MPLSTAVTYQGRLDDGAGPVNANCDISFDLFNAASGGEFLGTSDQSNVPVVNGLFTVALDFGSGDFVGEARWLDVSVRCPTGSVGLFTTLTPRQAITTVPYAMHAGTAVSAESAATLNGLGPNGLVAADGDTMTGRLVIDPAIGEQSMVVKGNQAGGLGDSVAYFENRSGEQNAGPVIRAVGTGGSYPSGVLSVSNNGTGDIPRFGNSCCNVASLDNDGNFSIDGDLTVGGQINGGNVGGGTPTGINWGETNQRRIVDRATVSLQQFGVEAPEPGYIFVAASVEVLYAGTASVVDVILREPQSGFQYTQCVMEVNGNRDRNRCTITWVIEKQTAGYQNLDLQLDAIDELVDVINSNLTAIFIPNRYD